MAQFGVNPKKNLAHLLSIPEDRPGVRRDTDLLATPQMKTRTLTATNKPYDEEETFMNYSKRQLRIPPDKMQKAIAQSAKETQKKQAEEKVNVTLLYSHLRHPGNV